MARDAILLIVLIATTGAVSSAQTVHLRIDRREVVLGGHSFGAAGPYEKLIGKVEFSYDPSLPANRSIVDLALAPRNETGRVECVADFYLLKPVDPNKGNGGLLYEVVNRGEKAVLDLFQGAGEPDDPVTADDFGDGWLMNQGYTVLWMGWQWDVPEGAMRMDLPIVTENGRAITGLVRGNIITARPTKTASLADRGHLGYPVVDRASDENTMTVRANRTDPARLIPHDRWRFTGDYTVELADGFEPGMIYDVVYRARDPRVVGLGLAGARDCVSFLKYDKSAGNPMPMLRYAIAWGISQSGRYLRHFVYEGFNADVAGRRVFDGVVDSRGGAGRGSFNHRFAQASRDALEHFNMLYPVDMFPFADGPETDPLTGQTSGLLDHTERSGTTPKFFHIISSSDYYNRAASLTHTDPTGQRDAEIPATSRIYFIASSQHVSGYPPKFLDSTLGRWLLLGAPRFHGDGIAVGKAVLSWILDAPVDRALFAAMDQWVARDIPPPDSQYPKIADGTLVPLHPGGWPAIPGYTFPPPQLVAYRLDFGPRWPQGIVDHEPPVVGAPFVVRVPAVDADGNDRAGIRIPEVAVPVATYFGWNYRGATSGAPDHLAAEVGSYIPFARTGAERIKTGDPRLSIAERYPSKAAYLEKIRAVTSDLIARRFLLAQDTPAMLRRGSASWDWATRFTDPVNFALAGVALAVGAFFYAAWRALRLLFRRRRPVPA